MSEVNLSFQLVSLHLGEGELDELEVKKISMISKIFAKLTCEQKFAAEIYDIELPLFTVLHFLKRLEI